MSDAIDPPSQREHMPRGMDTWSVSEANVEALRQGYEALNRRDLSVVLELLHPDMEWHEPAPGPDAGTHAGRESFEQFLRGWLDSFDVFQIEPERIIVQGDKLIAVIRQTGRGRSSGLVINARLAHVWTVRDGQAIRWEAVANPDDLGLS